MGGQGRRDFLAFVEADAYVKGMDRDQANAARFDAKNRKGHYESWFIRGNSPSGEQAFWIRYTIFQPAGAPEQAVGQRWAIVFRPEGIIAVKDELPITECDFSPAGLRARIGNSTLDDEGALGECFRGEHSIRWHLAMSGGDEPLLLLSERLYTGSFPKAKALVPRPRVRFNGALVVDGERISIDGWQGSQNHNWGLRHTDRYAWGQVASFVERDDAFLELSTAQLDIGPFRSPWFTPLTLRLGERAYEFGSLWAAAQNHGDYGAAPNGAPSPSEHPRWSFAASRGDVSIRGTIHAPGDAFVALPYGNPPGGEKICLNTKCAHCELTLVDNGERHTLTSKSAAFEILSDVRPGNIPLAF
ncbi:MAG: hypothetical protein ACI9KE_003033 [Polyangiales bacterium]